MTFTSNERMCTFQSKVNQSIQSPTLTIWLWISFDNNYTFIFHIELSISIDDPAGTFLFFFGDKINVSLFASIAAIVVPIVDFR